jgi:ZIP family zinc transporter
VTAVLLLALLPVTGNAVGAATAELVPRSGRWLNRGMHAAVGVVVGVIAIEIFPAALTELPPGVLAAAFAVGGIGYLGFEAVVEQLAGRRSRAWMIYVAVAFDLLGDGLMIGAGTASSAALGASLAVGQVLADVPEGFATVSALRASGVPRRRRVAVTAALVVPAVAGAAVAYLTLRGRTPAVQHVVLVATAGLFAVAIFEDLMTEAHEAAEDTRLSTLFFLGGVAAFALSSGAVA